MNDILDILGEIECHELAWSRLIMGEITAETSEHYQLIEAGECKEWMLWLMLKQHVVKMDLLCAALKGIEDKVLAAEAIARQG